MRVAIIDDHMMIREGLGAILRTVPTIEVVGEAATGEEGIRLIRDVGADVALMDIRMPGMGGLAATQQVVKSSDCKVVVMTVYDDVEYLQEALKVGASGFILKQIARDDLVRTLERVYDGQTVIDSAQMDKLVKSMRNDSGKKEEDVNLSPREIDVLHMLVKGFSNKEIAGRLIVSVHTVNSHVRNIYQKLEVNDRASVTAKAMLLKLVQ